MVRLPNKKNWIISARSVPGTFHFPLAVTWNILILPCTVLQDTIWVNVIIFPLSARTIDGNFFAARNLAFSLSARATVRFLRRYFRKPLWSTRTATRPEYPGEYLDIERTDAWGARLINAGCFTVSLISAEAVKVAAYCLSTSRRTGSGISELSEK